MVIISHLVGGEQGVVVGLLLRTRLLDGREVLGHVRWYDEALCRVETEPVTTKNIHEKQKW